LKPIEYDPSKPDLNFEKRNNMIQSNNRQDKHCKQMPLKRARVRFAVEKAEEPILKGAVPLFQCLTLEISRQLLWYQNDEITGFKRDIGTILVHGSSNEDDRCGLERHSLERDKAKKYAVRLVVLAQKLGNGAEFLRTVSRKCSAHARDLAFVQGLQDYCQVYNEEEPLPSFTVKQLSRQGVATSVRCKRKTMENLHDTIFDRDRRVRQRINE
jgi:hypothetical protein